MGEGRKETKKEIKTETVQTRIVDAAAYIGMLRGMTEEGYEVSFRITGSSMSPFLIHRRDVIDFKKPDRPLRRGDMVFYQRDSGQYVMHRIVRVCADGTLDLLGDAQTQVEHGVRKDQVFGLVTRIHRKGKTIEPGDAWWIFFERVWPLLRPIRPLIARVYAKLIR